MGINGILPRILPSAGRENYDLRSLRDGLIITSTSSSGSSKRKRSWKRRKVRLAVDLHGWISRACHGNGAYLMDERHLSYHGRAMLKRQRAAVDNDAPIEAAAMQQQQQQQMEYVQKVIYFIMQRISYLEKECNIEILLVLDGATPPIKQCSVDERRDRRKQAVDERDAYSPVAVKQPPSTDIIALDEATTTEREAISRINASKRAGSGIDSTLRTLLHNHLLQELRANNYPFLISPYEADGQLAHLSQSHQVDGIITEDSDLICMEGVRRLLYKLGGWNGTNSANRGSTTSSSSAPDASGLLYGTLLERQDLGSSRGIDLLDFSDGMLVVMFVAAGCDYCDSLRGIGIMTARDIVERVFLNSASSRREEPVLRRVLNELYQKCHGEARAQYLPLNDEDKAEARDVYEKAFLGAVAMYRHPLVYDPVLGDVIANDVSSSSSTKTSKASPQFWRDEQILMDYEPYRKLVTDREALYQVVGSPRPLDLAHKMARGLVDRQGVDITENAAPLDDSESNNNNNVLPDTQDELLNPPATQENNSSTYNHDSQPSSQEFTVLDTSAATQPSTQEFSVAGGRGTQQSKSSKSSSALSSLSPDLLASPSPAKRHSQ
eukprot:scaffold21342_cov66-Cyclotella_meneghiniana.AAC.8